MHYKVKSNGYYWIAVPNGTWPMGGYFDGRGERFGTPLSKRMAEVVIELTGEQQRNLWGKLPEIVAYE